MDATVSAARKRAIKDKYAKKIDILKQDLLHDVERANVQPAYVFTIECRDDEEMVRQLFFDILKWPEDKISIYDCTFRLYV